MGTSFRHNNVLDRLGGPIVTNACAPKWSQELVYPNLAWTHSSYSVYRVNKSVMASFYPLSTLFCQVVRCKSSYSSRAVMGYLNLHASLCSQVLQDRLPYCNTCHFLYFLGEIGGSMGLFLGCSLITIWEWLDFILTQIFTARERRLAHPAWCKHAPERFITLFF